MVVGDVDVLPLLDAVGDLGDLRELYPDVALEEWDPYRGRYPELFAGSHWRLPCGVFLVRSAGTTVLVDTGVGPPGHWAWNAQWNGGLPRGLDRLGVGRDEIDVVLLTHLHVDHIGWNADADGAVYFPRARYLAHRDALAFVRSFDDRPHVQRCVVSLEDRFEELAGVVELAPGVTTRELPGHYPGHLGVAITSGGAEALLTIDAAVHPALLDRPEWEYVSDVDRLGAVATRRALLDELLDSEVLVGCGHYPGGLGRVVRRDGRVEWQAASAT